MAECPHGCVRCRLIEAGLGGQPLTPRQFLDHFEIIEPTSERAPLAEDTLEAAAAVELARIAYDEAHRAVGEIISEGNPRAADYGDALGALTADRSEAGARLQSARNLYHALAMRDQEAFRLARQAAEQRERAERLQAERSQRRKVKCKGFRDILARGSRD